MADSYLCWSFPIYVGTSGIGDDFPEDSYFRSNPDLDLAELANQIVERLNRGLSEKDIMEMSRARESVLYFHNLFAVIEALISKLPLQDLLAKPELIKNNFDPRPKIVFKKMRRSIMKKIRNFNKVK